MDSSLFHADIFFFLSTILLSLVVLLLLVAIGYAIGVLRRIRRIAALVENEAQKLIADADALRAKLKETGGTAAKGVLALLAGFMKKKRKRS